MTNFTKTEKDSNFNTHWTPPVVISGEEARTSRGRVIETIDSIVDDRVEQRFGRHEVSPAEVSTARSEIFDEVQETSNWIYFPWNDMTVRYPSAQDHLDLRTWRNKNLNTTDEQQKLYDTKMAVFGLSVGSNVVEQLTQSGIGNYQIKADYDTISLANLNRIRATMADVGLAKTIWLGRKVAQMDPYITQIQLENGYEGEKTDVLLEEQMPNLLFDEVDNLAVKAMIRRVGQKLRIPVIQVGDIDERSVVDVERYDLEEGVEPFNGRLSSTVYDRLLSEGITDPAEVIPLLVELNGQENISPRLFESALNKDLGGLPQRGATAAAGAAFVDRIVRGIILGDDIPSGRYVLNPDEIIKFHK